MPLLGTPLADAKFSLSSTAVAGFFGGEEAISAMETVHLYEGRRWLGWYNSPGSYMIARRFGRVASSRFSDGLFPGPNDSPALLLGLDGKDGPKYMAALSGTVMQTGHLGYLTMKQSQEMQPRVIQGRVTTPCYISYLPMNQVDYTAPVERPPFKDALFAIIPIACSVVACIFCALVYDWYCFSMILLGILSSGLASCAIGRGELFIESVRRPAEGSPPGHGVLIGGNEAVVIKGDERDVNAITKGRYLWKKEVDIERSSEESRYHAIAFCSLLLIAQFLFQLILIPQGSLFGQIMFLSSLGVSWAYNSYLSSQEKEKIQTDILFKKLRNPEMLRFRVGTRTTMAVFACLLLFHGVHISDKQDARNARTRILESYVLNDTVVWRRWKERVVEQLLHLDNEYSASYLEEGNEDLGLPTSQRMLLKELLDDAKSALRGYFDHSGQLKEGVGNARRESRADTDTVGTGQSYCQESPVVKSVIH